ncbi:MAG TPA: ABC transporter ATP-binding protein [Gemmatimonadales bacterium]|nr:ABC transporter ATP-binding protein [Gemmatimonadales bacterium]
MSQSAPAIETERLGRDYGEIRALDSLDLRVPQGSLVGLLGPNGAGKTTAMLLLATLLAPSRGTARIFGHDVTQNRSAVRRRLGLVFQEPSVDGLLTVEENLLFAARLAGLRARTTRVVVAEAMEHTGLTARAATPARQLSGGWRRLLDITRASLHQPDLLILDEPTVGLDPEHRERLWSMLEGQRRSRGTTILFSTHYLIEAEPSDRVVLLSAGRVVAADTPEALRSSVGLEVAEIEGPGTERLLKALRGLGAAVSSVHTERGVRVGLRGSREAVVELAGSAPGIERFALRPATLEDVYFARTRGSATDTQSCQD